MSTLSDHPKGATPLTEEDLDGLIPTWVATRADLNQAEQRNIAVAAVWAYGRRFRVDTLTQEWLKDLHRRMFEQVWRWAGGYRKVDTNIGDPWYEIQTSVEQLVLDVHEQCSNEVWPPDEIAVRFHHRLVSIHPFRNGNGRHARLAADVIVMGLEQEVFPWGAGAELTDVGPAREEYLAALQTADRDGNYSDLLAFARQSA